MSGKNFFEKTKQIMSNSSNDFQKFMKMKMRERPIYLDQNLFQDTLNDILPICIFNKTTTTDQKQEKGKIDEKDLPKI